MNKKDLVLKINEGECELIDFNFCNFKNSTVESICLLCNDILIGDAILFDDSSDNSIYLEFLDIEEEYRRMGYGSYMLSLLKSSFKEWEYININGECKDSLVPFYFKSGAKFENRCEDDWTYFNRRFYIDLN